QVLQKNSIAPHRRYHLDTNEAVLSMVAMGLGWTILPPLAVFKSIEKGADIRASLSPGKALYRTLYIGSRRGEGLQIAAKIRDAAIEALKQVFLPRVRVSMPDIARRI